MWNLPDEVHVSSSFLGSKSTEQEYESMITETINLAYQVELKMVQAPDQETTTKTEILVPNLLTIRYYLSYSMIMKDTTCI